MVTAPMNNQLQELTDATIKEIRKLEIVLPEIYRDIFYTKAGELEIVIAENDKEQTEWVEIDEVEEKLAYQNLKDIWKEIKPKIIQITNEIQ